LNRGFRIQVFWIHLLSKIKQFIIKIPTLRFFMTKWLSIYVILNLSALTLPKSYTISIFRLGNLIAHYHHHENASGDHNIFTFLSSHYLNQTHHEASHEDHENLPFHSHHRDNFSFTLQSPSLLPQPTSNLTFPKLVIISSITIIQLLQWISSFYPNEIWQPPRA